MLHQSAWWNNAALHHVAVRGAWACTVPTPHLLLSDALSAASRFQLRLSHLPSQSETPCLVCFLLQPFFFLSLCPLPLSVDLHSVCLSLPDGHTHARARAGLSTSWFVLSHSHVPTLLPSLRLQFICAWSSLSLSLPLSLPSYIKHTAGRSWTFVMLLLLLLREPTPIPGNDGIPKRGK